MQTDDMLQYFTDLSLKMDGSKVLRKARQLLLKFRQLPYIPCCVRGLLSGPGVWDSAPLPIIECQCRGVCIYDEQPDQQTTTTDLKTEEDEREKYQDELSEKDLTTKEESDGRKDAHEEEEMKEETDEIIVEEEKSSLTEPVCCDNNTVIPQE